MHSYVTTAEVNDALSITRTASAFGFRGREHRGPDGSRFEWQSPTGKIIPVNAAGERQIAFVKACQELKGHRPGLFQS